jgi:hypothetical protein
VQDAELAYDAALQHKREDGLGIVEQAKSQQTRLVPTTGIKTRAFVVVDAFELGEFPRLAQCDASGPVKLAFG